MQKREASHMGKMRVTQHSGRTHRNGKTYSTKHNDRNFDTPALNIDPEKTALNVVWTWCGKFSEEITIDEAEQKYYEENYSDQLKATNEKYIKSRHKERIVSMEKWRKQRIHSPEETIMQIGKLGNSPAVDLFYKCWLQYLDELEKWNMETGNHMHILNWALHQDELGAAHVHSRRIWDYDNPETNTKEIGQEKALESAGVQLPFPDKEISRTNNRKITFDKMSRTIWQNIAMENGLEIETIPLPKNETGKSLDQYINDQEEKRRLEEEKLKAMKQAEIEREEAFLLQEALSLAKNERKEEALEEEEKRLQQLKESIEKETSELEKRKKEATEKEAAIEIKETDLNIKIKTEEENILSSWEIVHSAESEIYKKREDLNHEIEVKTDAFISWKEDQLQEIEIKSRKEKQIISDSFKTLKIEQLEHIKNKNILESQKREFQKDKTIFEEEKNSFFQDKEKTYTEINKWKEAQITEINNQAAAEQKKLDERAEEIQKNIDSFQPKLKKIDEWETAVDIYHGEEEKPETYIYNQFIKRQENTIDQNTLFQNVKKCVSGFIAKLKKGYDNTINELKKRLNGYDYTDKMGNSLHSFGAGEIEYMFIQEATPQKLRQIADDMESEGVENYIELHKRKPKILERHFEYARERTQEREITRS